MTDPAYTLPTFEAISVEDYLRLEANSPTKHEYVAGFVYPLAQAGVSRRHSAIAGNILATLHRAARQQNCFLCANQRLLQLPDAFLYPDVMLICDTKTGSDTAETAPCLLVEVLSPSTAQIDRVGKWAMYTALPSLQTYLIVHQDERRVVEYARTAEGWQMREVVGDGEISLPCLGIGLTLEDIYGGVF